ncbi:MAG: DUF4115 domain-containing protein [Algicola sp.]|nr:DUF4115 domain-containing protein [Algicola sp.]
MKPQQTEEVTENIEVVTPGVLLKEARVSLQLTPADIAKRLNLKDTLIEDIERNEFDDMPSITFARGYLKAYAKLVRVSESDVLEAYEYLSSAEQQQLEMQSFSHRSSQLALDKWLKIFSYLVIVVIIVLAVVWWFQRNPATPPVTAPDNTAAVVQNSAVIVGGPPAEQVVDSAGEQATVILINNDVSAQDANTQDEPEQHQVLKQQQVQNNQVQSTALLTESATTVDGDLTHLELRFSDDCWINIADANGERIAIGTKIKGHLTSVYGVAPFTIKLGKPGAVSIWLDGVKKEMPYYPKGSVANFELSLN